MKLPKLDDLIGEQLDIYDFPSNNSLFVAGPPGSGKTSLAVARARVLANMGETVTLVTKNRMLACLASQLGENSFHTTTMHTFVAGHYGQRFGQIPQYAPYLYNWQKVIEVYLKHNIQPTLDHLIIDEAQNLPPDFFRWAILFGARNVSVFADEDQSTISQNSTLQDIVDAGFPPPKRLTVNHRNTEEIALVAEHFHQSGVLPPATVVRGRSGDIPQLISLATWDDFAIRIVTRYRNRATCIGVIVGRRLEALDLYDRIKKLLPNDTRVNVYVSGLEQSIVNAIRSSDPGITILTGESVIGLEFEDVFLHDIGRSLPCKTTRAARRMYMLCARARDSLILIDGPLALSNDQINDLPDATILRR
ncbi:AAA family ATPase [Oxalobacteraceae sp. CFBP 13730]|nr:AAA family ATPase [Oxalobacteraceae sp. CFBP 13730]